MAGNEDVLTLAQSGNRAAIEEVFGGVHPALHRISRELTGEEERADQVVNNVFHNSLRVLPQWSSWGDPETWFYHQAVQAARRVSKGRPDSAEDLLVTALPADQRSPAYVAFVRGVRRLPPQQVEAFLLHHGERLNARLLGVAMDCSTTAAETHLKAADAALQPLAGDDWTALTTLLAKACRSLSPTKEEAEQVVRLHVGGWAGRRAKQRIRRLIVLAVVIVSLLVAWQFRETIKERLSPGTQRTQ
jgi:DNA-directed RNA polymerase specialized sigma24 family protein